MIQFIRISIKLVLLFVLSRTIKKLRNNVLTDIDCNEPDSKEIQSKNLSLDCEFAHRESPAPSQFLGGLLCLLASGKGTTHSTCSLGAQIQGLVFLVLYDTINVSKNRCSTT